MAVLETRDLGLTDYDQTWSAMKSFTAARSELTPDELWLTEHSPVFTQGQAGKPEHVLFAGNIPVIQTDRGGQVTYHGPGQLVLYTLFDLGRHRLGVRPLVRLLEGAIIQFLEKQGVSAQFKVEAPGVYVENKKIASVGLRVRQGRAYHGVSFNVDMDLSPFNCINPCGFSGLEVVDLRRLGITLPMSDIKAALSEDIAMRWEDARTARESR